MDFTNEKKKQSNLGSNLILLGLVILLVIVIFYVIFVHLPYNDHQRELDSIRTSIIEKDKLNYDNYFMEYNRSKTYYIIRVKIKGKKTYLAYNDKKKLVDKYSDVPVSESVIIADVENRVKETVSEKDIKVGYEDDQFRYIVKYQTDNSLNYLYYTLDGKFVKQYRL
ncbi:MAG: hypothetical protein ACI4WQ_07510 [Sharpea porci]